MAEPTKNPLQAGTGEQGTSVAEKLVALGLPEWVEPEMLQEFLATQTGALEDVEREILEVEGGSEEGLAELKRRLHTMKGEAGAIGLCGLERVFHAMEDCLAAAPPDRSDRLLEAKDWLASTLASLAKLAPPESPADKVVALLTSVPPAADTAAPDPATADPATADTAAAGAATAGAAAPAPGAADLPSKGGARAHRDPETVAMLGEFIVESDEGLGSAEQLLMNVEHDGPSPESTNGLFRIVHNIKGGSGFYNVPDVTALAHRTETLLDLLRDGVMELRGAVLDLVLDAVDHLRQLLSAVRDAVDRDVEFPASPEVPQLLARLQAAIDGEPPPPAELPAFRPGTQLGEILETIAAVPPSRTAAAAVAQKVSGLRLGEELVAQGDVRPKQLVQALRAQAEANRASTARIRGTVKVDLERVDSLVEMIGELVIVQSMVVNAPEMQAITSHRTRNYLGHLTKIVRDLQGVGMHMRMVPLRAVFQKMARLVRDLSHKSGKEVQVALSGEGTEMDRSMVEQIGDPLVHMIRNAVDHGIEPAAERAAAGKPPVATVRLSAFHEGGSIAIEIGDDGGGLRRDAILAKARAQGLISGNQELSDDAVFSLIFAPGFSTAKQITELSGRGVGMDVVKRSIEAMRGRISIASAPGRGTTFKILLPLTLAIIDGMLVSCGEERYIIPTLSVVESIKPDASMLFCAANRAEVLNIRGQILTLLRLDRLFDIPGAKSDPVEALVVILESGGRRFGLLVDNVLSQQQVVIKSLDAGIQIPFVSGAAILPDGKVGMIVNVEEIGDEWWRREQLHSC